MSFTMSAIVSRPFTLAPVSESMYENKCSFGVIVSGDNLSSKSSFRSFFSALNIFNKLSLERISSPFLLSNIKKAKWASSENSLEIFLSKSI